MAINLKSIILNEEQLDKNNQVEADVRFIDLKGKEIKFKYDFLGSRDKDINKVVDLIKRKFPYVKDLDLSFIDELELLRQMKQNGTLNSSNNILYFYCENKNGEIVLKTTKDKNLATQKSLSTKIDGK